jgi:P2 family phage contractile tail tube protein
MALKMKFRAIYKDLGVMMSPDPCMYDLRMSVQAMDAGASEYISYPSRVVVRGTPKKKGLGKLNVGKKMDNDFEFVCTYLKVFVDGEEVLEVDKLNFIYRVNGVDALASVREHLGLTN